VRQRTARHEDENDAGPGVSSRPAPGACSRRGLHHDTHCGPQVMAPAVTSGVVVSHSAFKARTTSAPSGSMRTTTASPSSFVGPSGDRCSKSRTNPTRSPGVTLLTSAGALTDPLLIEVSGAPHDPGRADSDFDREFNPVAGRVASVGGRRRMHARTLRAAAAHRNPSASCFSYT
jgi:hypothetical protein